LLAFIKAVFSDFFHLAPGFKIYNGRIYASQKTVFTKNYNAGWNGDGFQ
jgi:hypothetical protein